MSALPLAAARKRTSPEVRVGPIPGTYASHQLDLQVNIPRRLFSGRGGTLDTLKPQPQNKKITQIVSTETTPTDIRVTTRRSSMIGGASPCNAANWPSSFLRRGGTGEASCARLCRSRSPISSQIARQCFGSKGAWVRSGSCIEYHRRSTFPCRCVVTRKVLAAIPRNRSFFNISGFIYGGWQARRRPIEFPSVGDLFLTSAITASLSCGARADIPMTFGNERGRQLRRPYFLLG